MLRNALADQKQSEIVGEVITVVDEQIVGL